MKTEACIETYEEALAAADAGLNRIELCGALDIGGITPSHALIEKCSLLPIEVHVMIRPRGGNFSYTSDEIDLMASDIETASKLGAKGVVFGILGDSWRG